MSSALFRRSFLFGCFFLLIAACSTAVNASSIPFQPDSPIIARIDFTGTITSLDDPGRLFGTGSEAVELFVGDPIFGGYVFTENGDEDDYGWYSLGPPERRASDSDYFISVDLVGEDGSAGSSDLFSLVTLDGEVVLSLLDPGGSLFDGVALFDVNRGSEAIPSIIPWLPGDAANRTIADEAFGWHGSLDSVTVTIVPVPAALPLFLAGLGIFGFVSRRKP